MKLLVLSFVLASTSIAALAADNPSVSGNWNIHINVAGNESDSVCTFTQKDSDLTGTCTNDNGTGPASGKIDGTKVTWSYKSEYNGSPLTLKYSGTFDPEAKKITGSVNIEEFSVDGDFTATFSK